MPIEEQIKILLDEVLKVQGSEAMLAAKAQIEKRNKELNDLIGKQNFEICDNTDIRKQMKEIISEAIEKIENVSYEEDDSIEQKIVNEDKLEVKQKQTRKRKTKKA